MPTLSQLAKKGRARKTKKIRATALRRLFNAKDREYKALNSPQKRGVVTLVKTMTPKKPNSALRKVARVKLSNKMEVTAYIQGIGHSLSEHGIVLVRGKFDLLGVENRKTSRSVYGTKRSSGPTTAKAS